MLCVKCGQDNPLDANECEKCGALLVREENDQDESLLDIESGFSYLYPERMYINPVTFNMVKTAFEYSNQKAEKDDVALAFEAVKKRFNALDQEIIPDMLETLYEYKLEDVSKEYARQMMYLLKKGSNLSKEGIGKIENFLATEEFDRLVEGVFRVQEGNDYLNLAGELIKANLQFLQEEICRRKLASRADEFQAKMKDAQEAQEAREAKFREENPDAYIQSKTAEEVMLTDDE